MPLLRRTKRIAMFLDLYPAQDTIVEISLKAIQQKSVRTSMNSARTRRSIAVAAARKLLARLPKSNWLMGPQIICSV